jgi:S-adenosyl-L-methionine hydrolase (adenosine-forming)
MAPAHITLLTDYGLDDDFVGICHAVIARIAPEARVVDLSHGVPRHDVHRAAVLLRAALPYLPDGVHVTVVDPEVGSPRRPVALRTNGGRIMVGPDNGALMLAADHHGGVAEAYDVGASPWRLEPVSATFHGRDIFCPVAAHLAAGEELAHAGEPVDPMELQRLDLPEPHVEDDEVVAHVMTVDRFGNAALDVSHDQLTEWGFKLGRRVVVQAGPLELPAQYARTFADVGPGELLLYEDAWRTLAIAVNRGDAAKALGLAPGDEVRLREA